MSKVVGIIGGMGPEATLDIFGKIIEYTDGKKDQDHLRIIIDNNTNIPDRTKYILGRGENPLKELTKTGIKLKNFGADILIMPCNTAHYFYEDLKKAIDIPFINMIDEVGKHIYETYGECSVGLLATEGTYKAKVYETYLNKYNIKVQLPSMEHRKKILDIIYKVKSGDTNIKVDEVLDILNKFYLKNIDKVILGCTELPLIFHRFKDKRLDKFKFMYSTDILAKKTVEIAK